MSEVVIYSLGIVAASVCAPSDMDRDEIERQVNLESPTGIESSWAISDDETFADGTANGSPCEQKPDVRRHWLLKC